ncbi:MAG TPA: hypothetical protein EYP33_05085 [Pyrodictium sp.]|nr:hypothetical protein [Pyrodictium sp.]
MSHTISAEGFRPTSLAAIIRADALALTLSFSSSSSVALTLAARTSSARRRGHAGGRDLAVA